jgi:hypothetical protein
MASGIPALSGNTIISDVVLLVEDTFSLAAAAYGPQWGIFLNGESVVAADSVVSFDYKQDWTLSDFPIENGGFASYDKVQLPFDARITFSAGGSVANRQAFLDSIAAIAGTFDLYDVVTPEEVYQSVNIIHYDYRRTSNNGVGLIVVNIFMNEVRISSASSFSGTQTPSGANPVNSGQVQTLTPSALQKANIPDITLSAQ